MKVCTATLKSTSPYSQSRPVDLPKQDREPDNEYEKRTWSRRAHVADDGRIFIPPMAFKNALSEIAKYLSMKIPSMGKATYTKHFEAGILVSEPTYLDVTIDQVIEKFHESNYVPSNGVRGDGKRVWRTYPRLPEWSGKVTFYILDDIITKDVFEEHLRKAGQFIGIGRFRPRNNGWYGRFDVVKTEWAAQQD